MTLATMLVRLDERSGLYISEALPTDVKLFLANETNALDKPERLSRYPMGFTPDFLSCAFRSQAHPRAR